MAFKTYLRCEFHKYNEHLYLYGRLLEYKCIV